MNMSHSLDEIRSKAHSINCQLSEEGYTPREIEIIGYYLNRIAASYLSYFTHKEYERSIGKDMSLQEAEQKYTHLEEMNRVESSDIP